MEHMVTAVSLILQAKTSIKQSCGCEMCAKIMSLICLYCCDLNIVMFILVIKWNILHLRVEVVKYSVMMV